MMGQTDLLDAKPAAVGRPGDAELGLSRTVQASNAAAAALLGYADGELVGMPLASLLPAVQPDGSASESGFERRRAAVRADVPQCFLWQFRHRQGASVDLLVQLD